jgi:hypothetical protein
MNLNRWTAATRGALTLGLFLTATASARADQVTPIETLDEANRLSVFHDYGLDVVGRTQSDTPGSPGGGVATYLLGGLGSTDPNPPDRAASLSLTPFAGYDSNPEAFRRANGGAFGGGDFLADYKINIGSFDPTVGSKTEFYFSYDGTGVVYSGKENDGDAFQQTLTGNVRHNLFDDTVILKWDFNDQFTMLHGSAFLNTFETRPSVESLLTRQTSVEFGYDYTNFQYYIPVRPVRNPDADRSTFQFQFHFYTFPQQRGPVPDSPDVLTDILRDSFKTLTIGYDAKVNEASGNDYDYRANRVYIGARGIGLKAAPDLSLDLMYSHEWDHYDHPNNEGVLVLAGKGGERIRHDELDIFTLRGNARLLDLSRHRGTLTSFVQWDIVQDHSNIFPRHFNDFVLSGGLTYRF